MRGVCGGALLGLGDFRRDAYASALHMSLLQKRYPRAEVSFSVPRLRPYKNNAGNNPNDVHEPQLLQIMLAFRIFMPFAGINISTRERAGFRDHVIGLCATKISAGVKTGVGGHEEEAKGDEQFQISATPAPSLRSMPCFYSGGCSRYTPIICMESEGTIMARLDKRGDICIASALFKYISQLRLTRE